MDKHWSLYFTGVGAIDAAESMLANLVSKLRDIGLTITNVQVTGPGEYHALAEDTSEGEAWTMFVFGDGEVGNDAYPLFREQLDTLANDGINVLDSGINVGTLRNIPVPA